MGAFESLDSLVSVDSGPYASDLTVSSRSSSGFSRAISLSSSKSSLVSKPKNRSDCLSSGVKDKL